MDKRKILTAKATELAHQLLVGGPRYKREGNVSTDLVALLSEVGIDFLDIEREHPVSIACIDIYVPRYRVIVETKAQGKIGDPNESESGRSVSARAQLERYVTAEIDGELKRLPFESRERFHTQWTGIVTDGQHWHVYSYPHAEHAIAKRRRLHSGPIAGGAADLVEKLSCWLDCDPVGRTWIPADPSHLFKAKEGDLVRLYGDMPDGVRRRTEKKRALWHDMLRVSGMSPPGLAAPDRLFVTHSFLIAIARMVTHLIARRTDKWKVALNEGFASWVLDWPQGEAWARELWGVVSQYDWHRRRGDVLRSLYETFVEEGDRKVFGEFYTPDWLAAKMVEEALDDEWLDDAIQKADDAVQNGTEFKGMGVLDPACGSGTFLYHAALRMLEAPAMEDLQPQQKANVAALLLNGIDVHPVAVEIAKANLMRVFQPTAGESALRVYLGDSLLTVEDRDSLFGHVEGSMRLVTPQGHEILIPVEFVKRDGFGDSMRRLVNAAARGKDLPAAVLNKVPEHLREALTRCKDDLASAIGDEGNSVWTWYAINISAPHLLSERKVDRIVANPPWVKLAHIQERGRKRSMEKLAERMGLQAGGKLAPHLDIATFFVLRSRELYLNDPEKDPAVWLVKKSALRAGHWKPFREKHGRTLAQSVDLEELRPFGSGDARRCCLLMEHRPWRSGSTSGGISRAHQKTPYPPRLEARLQLRGKLKPEESWSAVRDRIQFTEVPDPLPQEHSEYSTDVFRQGATIVPQVLLVVERQFPQAGDRIRVRTEQSLHAPWSGVPSQDVEIPKRWLSGLYRARNMLPFVDSLVNTKAIIPMDRGGMLNLESALDELAWEQLDEIYRSYKGKGKATPKALAAQIDFAGKLSSQPRDKVSEKRMVLYLGSGDVMRSARTFPGSGVVGHTLFWFVADSEDEAAYLAALLNAPCLRQAFFESRESGRDFQLHPWRKVPIPKYDSANLHHLELAQLCARAEQAARSVAVQAKEEFPKASQVKLSNAVRARLAANGILRAIDKIATQLLPDHAVTVP